MKRIAIFGAVAWLALGTVAAQATTIFENYKGAGATSYTEETRPATDTFGTVVNTTADITINKIEFRMTPLNDMNVTIGIFESELTGTFGSVNWTTTGNALLFNQTKFVAAPGGSTPDYDIVTDPFSFTFLANRRYDIVVVGDTGSMIGSWDIQNGDGSINTVQGGFESINQNSNNSLTPFASNVGYASVDPHIRLSSGVAPVPLPATLPLAAVAIAALGLIGRRATTAKTA